MQPARMQPAQLGARRQVWILKGRREEDEPYRARWEHGAHPRRAGCRDSSWFRSGVPGLTLYRARSHGRDGQPPGLHLIPMAQWCCCAYLVAKCRTSLAR